MASAGPQRSQPLQRRLRLLQVVLPCFPPAIAPYYHSAKKLNREFWTKFLTPCLGMELAKWPFHQIDDKHAELVKLVLEKLETVVGIKEEDIAEQFKSLSFPRLETVRKVREETDGSDDIHIELVKPGTTAGCRDLVDLLTNLSSIMKDDTEQPPPEDVRTTSKSKPLMAPQLLNLFSTISKYWRCTCKTPHQAALLLFTNRSLPKNDSSACFTVLLSQAMVPRLTKRWQEAGITICEQFPKPRVRISFPDSKREKRNPVTDLCATIKKSTMRLNLNIEGASLSSQAETDPQMKNFENCELVSFTKGFLENESELQIHEKVCLAVILSYAFLDFCGKPWFPRGWTKDSLYLMQHERTLFLQPFLVTNMGAKQSEPESLISIANARAETLLLHGILLMEIFGQEPLPTSSRLDGNFTSLKDMAQERFESIEWDVYERFRRVVEVCIQGTLIDTAMIPSTICPRSRVDLSRNSLCNAPETSDEVFARLFCERVSKPLEVDFNSQWPNKDADEVISTIKLPSIKQELNPYQKPKPTASKSFPQQNPKPRSQTSSRQSIQSPFTLTPLSLKNTNLKFFDVLDDPDATQVKGALRWFENFDVDDVQKCLPKRAAVKENRINIAVLDTGINLKNIWISQRTGRIQCWPSVEDCEDKDGHGTQVAHLLLRLAPHAHLRIAKVSKTRLLKDAGIKKIADAIVHFSTGKGRVDIINLSFGFPNYTEMLYPILTAIRAARDNGVIIFAAAGNDGGNKGVFWPASLHDGGHVIRINSSDGNGVPSGFNPHPEVGRRICTLGEGVPSCQPNPKKLGQMIHRSGTSFATPIAASIAAIILGFMDSVEESTEFSDLKDLSPRLRTAMGMERVLCELCVGNLGSKRSGFSYITPWLFLERQEKIRVHLILDILSKVPESPVLC